jgi:hypothetical protein
VVKGRPRKRLIETTRAKSFDSRPLIQKQINRDSVTENSQQDLLRGSALILSKSRDREAIREARKL